MRTQTNSRAPADEPPVLCETENGVRRLTLNRPEQLNCLSHAMVSQLHELFGDAANDEDCRVIVLGAKGRVFSAGHDMREFADARADADGGIARYEALFKHSSQLMQAIVSHPRPVIADVRGVATAAGCQLVASCDMVVASENAQFATPGVNIGLFCSTPMVALSRKVASNHAMEMLLTGEKIDSRRALEIGLVNHVWKEEEMDARLNRMAQLIASKSKMTVAMGKAAFYRQIEMPVAEAYSFTGDVMARNMMKHDAIEGIDAFRQKRKPQWKDK